MMIHNILMMSRDRCDMFCWLVIINFFPCRSGVVGSPAGMSDGRQFSQDRGQCLATYHVTSRKSASRHAGRLCNSSFGP